MITIGAFQIQPELFALSCQIQICLITPLMQLLTLGIKNTEMNIQHLTGQANRPETNVVINKGLIQSNSFTKYAAAFFYMSRSSVTRFSSF